MNSRVFTVTMGVAALLFATVTPLAAADAPPEVVATGLTNPRGLAFAPDGSLYVAEAGSGGDRVVRAGLARVPYHVGWTARVVRIDPDGTVGVVLNGLPSVYGPYDVFGATGVAVVDDTLYVLTAAGGRDVQDPTFDNAILRVRPDGSANQLVDLTAYNLAQPPLARQLDSRADVEGGVPYGLTSFDGHLYATDGNLEVVAEIGLDGGLRRLLEYPASDHVLVGLTAGPDGALYVAEFSAWPHPAGAAKISRLTLDGELSEAWGGLTTAIGVVFGPDGTMYGLEFSSGRRVPGTGRLLHRSVDGTVEIVAEGLNFPTALAMGPDGNLYVAESGYRSEDGSGRIVRVRLVVAEGLEPPKREARLVYSQVP